MTVNPTHYVLWRENVPNSPMVKEADFFISQGGLTEPWGKSWVPVFAVSIGDARRLVAKEHGVKLSHIYDDEI